jgi:hypothetical protein
VPARKSESLSGGFEEGNPVSWSAGGPEPKPDGFWHTWKTEKENLSERIQDVFQKLGIASSLGKVGKEKTKRPLKATL